MGFRGQVTRKPSTAAKAVHGNMPWDSHPLIDASPCGFKAGDVNLYRFCGDNPTNATDPTGLEEQPDRSEQLKKIIASGAGFAGDRFAKLIGDPNRPLLTEQERELLTQMVQKNYGKDDFVVAGQWDVARAAAVQALERDRSESLRRNPRWGNPKSWARDPINPKNSASINRLIDAAAKWLEHDSYEIREQASLAIESYLRNLARPRLRYLLPDQTTTQRDLENQQGF